MVTFQQRLEAGKALVGEKIYQAVGSASVKALREQQAMAAPKPLFLLLLNRGGYTYFATLKEQLIG